MSSQDPNHPHAEGRPQPGYGQPPAYHGGHQDYGQPQAGPYGYHQRNMGHYGSQPGVHVGFGEAIKRFYSKYAQFSGRASRSEFWWATLYLTIISTVITILDSTVGTNTLGEPNGIGSLLSVVNWIFALSHLVPGLALGARRLHDTNRSGWLQLISFIPIVGALVLLVLFALPPKPEGARFDG